MPSQGWKQVGRAARSRLVPYFLPHSCQSPPTMKLTPELLAQASSALNPVKERQLDLRGKSAENLFVVLCQLPCQDTKSLQSKTLV